MTKFQTIEAFREGLKSGPVTDAQLRAGFDKIGRAHV